AAAAAVVDDAGCAAAVVAVAAAEVDGATDVSSLAVVEVVGAVVEGVATCLVPPDDPHAETARAQTAVKISNRLVTRVLPAPDALIRSPRPAARSCWLRRPAEPDRLRWQRTSF